MNLLLIVLLLIGYLLIIIKKTYQFYTDFNIPLNNRYPTHFPITIIQQSQYIHLLRIYQDHDHYTTGHRTHSLGHRTGHRTDPHHDHHTQRQYIGQNKRQNIGHHKRQNKRQNKDST